MPLEYMLTFPIIFYTKSYQNNNATHNKSSGTWESDVWDELILLVLCIL